MTRPFLGLLLILTSSEMSTRPTQGSRVFASEDLSAFSVSSPASPWLIPRKYSLNSSASLPNLPLPAEVRRFAPMVSDASEDLWNTRKLSMRVARAKRRAVQRLTDEGAYIGNSNDPSDEFLVFPSDILDFQSLNNGNSNRRNMAGSRSYIDADEDGRSVQIDGALVGGLAEKRRFPAMRLMREQLRSARQQDAEIKRKWKSKNMAMWGR